MSAVPVHPRTPSGALAAGAKLERYEILSKLAAGGMASVYVARVQAVAGFERLVAIKILHSNLAHEDEFIRMFLDEARLAAGIRHPNVVPTIDVSDSKEAGCGYFIVMEYIEGDHLGALLATAQKAAEKMPVPVALRIVADALAGLGAAHALCDDTGKSLQLVHRDVSPHNIMVGRDGVVRLTDFGVAKAEDRLTHTRDGQVKGKLAYMAPEQASSGATDARSDLFSVGVILWECLSGQRLFRGETTASTLHKLLSDVVPAPSSFDPALAPLDALVAKALARAPAERFQSAEEFARAIEEAAPQVGGMASLRNVARYVKTHAAAKLKREKKLVEDAVRALRPADAAETGAAVPDELTSPSSLSNSEVSVSQLSASKVSGVFAHDTLPGAQRIAGRRGSDLSVSLPTAPASGLLAPSAAQVPQRSNSDAATLRAPAPEAPLVPSHIAPADVRTRRQWPRLWVAGLLALFALIGWGGSYLGRASRVAPAPESAAKAEPEVQARQEPPALALPVAVSRDETPAPAQVAPNAGEGARPAVRAGTRRDDLPTARSYGRRTRRDVSTRASHRAPRSDVMPNPYHD